MIRKIDTIKACVLGLAVGDALGVPAEFKSREELDKNPVYDMRGYGTHNMPAGAWSDDTSMVLCALDSLSKEEFSFEDVMSNFALWRYEGKFTPTGVCFDSGIVCTAAIDAYLNGGKDIEHCGQKDVRDNGNGSLMRILPFALYPRSDAKFTEKASALTHAHRRSVLACLIYTDILTELIYHRDKNAYLQGLHKALRYDNDPEWQFFEPLYNIKDRSRDSIKSGGYVVDTLEAALWCLVNTDSYAQCVMQAVNLGGDTDTTAAVAGSLAGAVYGLEGIPQDWLDALIKREYIEDLCEKAAKRWEAI